MGALGSRELRLMQGLSQQVTIRRPELLNSEATVGEMAWLWAKDFDALSSFWRHRFWFEGHELVAWAWAWLPYRIPRGDGAFRQTKAANLVWQVHPDRPDLIAEVLDWYDSVVRGDERKLIVQSTDAKAQAIAASRGYVIDPEDSADTGSWMQLNMRELTDVPDPVLPEGFRFKSAAELSPADAVKAHRDAWQPSVFNETAFDRVRCTWPYRADLHLLIEAPDQTLAATAIIWFDDAANTAEFEPVGTHPAYRRRGLGTALQLYGMHQAEAAGATRMLVACLGASIYPAARTLYHGVGFRPITRDLPHTKVAD
ncbi:MAG: GNAT family N-acetyltransferase [Kiloniellales bacterium]